MRARFNQSFKAQAVEKAFSRSGDTTLKEVAASLGVGHSTLNRRMVQSRHPEFESIAATESPGYLGKQRGRLTVSAVRDGIVSLINNAIRPFAIGRNYPHPIIMQGLFGSLR